jgi:hypothetical protein
MNFTEYLESAKFTSSQKRIKGRPLNKKAALIMRTNEAYSQAASSTARKSNYYSTSSTKPSLPLPQHKITNGNHCKLE